MHKQIKSIIPYIIIIILLNKISTTDNVASCRTKSESRIIDAQRFKLSGTNQLILTTPATNQAKLITMSFLHKGHHWKKKIMSRLFCQRLFCLDTVQ